MNSFSVVQDRLIPVSRLEDAKQLPDFNSRSLYRLGPGPGPGPGPGDGEVKLILHYLLQNKRLKSLVLEVNSFSSADNWMALGELLRISTTLETLTLGSIDTDRPGFEHVVDGILNSTGCALACLRLIMDGTSNSPNTFTENLFRLLRECLTLKELHLEEECVYFRQFSPKAMESIAEGFAANTTLLKLYVRFPLGAYICRALTPIVDRCSNLQHRYNETLEELYISGCGLEGCTSICPSCYNVPFSPEVVPSMLQNNDSLRVLRLKKCFWDQKYWILVFRSLRSNRRLRKLELHNCRDIGVGDTFECLVGLLHVNFMVEVELDSLTLHHIEWKHSFKRRKEIELELGRLSERSKKIFEYMKLFDNLEQPKLGRVYLCGYPRAGKTTLRKKMVKTRTPLARLKALMQDERTQGIEIRTLQGRHAGELIAVWDMAGQEEYRALQDSHYLFPEINQACLFLFVFRAMDTTVGKFDSQAALSRLKRELCYWLTFINSNVARPRVTTPQISVVMTHYDKVADCFQSEDRYVDWARATVQEMRKKFDGQLEIHQTIHAVNSLSGHGVPEVVDHIRTNLGDMFPKLPKVPDICQKLSLVLAEWNVHHKPEPILTSQRFLELCQRKLHLPELSDILDVVKDHPMTEAAETIPPAAAKTISAEAADKILKRWHAVLSYLNDVGWIVKFETLDCIVVDVNWLGRKFLGMLFHSVNLREDLTPSDQGIIDVHKLEVFLAKFIRGGNYRGFKAGTLIQLMKELKICEDTSLSQLGSSSSSSLLFMPSLLKDDKGCAQEGTRRLRWTEIQEGSGATPVYVGFRLLCKDSILTFLSPGLFLRYQVHLFQKLSEVCPRSFFHYELEWNLIRVNHDGIEMLIESSGEHQDVDYVDILIRILGFTEARRQDAYEKGVSTFRGFCKSGDGCPGVKLQEEILRPECVEKLILCKYRVNQAVSRKDLEDMVVHKLQQGVAETQEDWTSRIYQHLFEAVDDSDRNLERALVEASDLLSSTDFHAIRTRFEQSRVDGTEQIDVIERIDAAVKDLERVTNSSICSHHEASTSSIVLAEVLDPEWGRSPIVELSNGDRQKDLPIGMKDLSQQLDSVIKALHLMMRNQDRDHEETLREVKNCGNLFMNTFQEEVLMEKIYRVSQLEHALPRLLYFTDFAPTLSERFVSRLKLGSALRLHFMCEEPHQMHFVKDQRGLPITKELPGQLMEKLRPLVLASAKMMYIFLKAGIHVVAGVGNMIPDIGASAGTELKAAFLSAETLISEIETSDQSEFNSDFKYAWKCLVEEIIGPMRDQIPQVFGLYKVVYKASALGKPRPISVHWICRECRQRAQRAGRLDMQNDIEFQGILPKSRVKS